MGTEGRLLTPNEWECPPRPVTLKIITEKPDNEDALNLEFVAQATRGQGHLALCTDGAVKDYKGSDVQLAGAACFTNGFLARAGVYLEGTGQCAYDAERFAILMALKWAQEQNTTKSILLYSDCKSALQKLEGWRRLGELDVHIAEPLERLLRGRKPKYAYETAQDMQPQMRTVS